MCQSVEILGKEAIVVATSSLVVGGMMRDAPAAMMTEEVVAVLDDGGGGGGARGLDVLSALPADVCPDTMRRYLDGSVM